MVFHLHQSELEVAQAYYKMLEDASYAVVTSERPTPRITDNRLDVRFRMQDIDAPLALPSFIGSRA